MNKDKLRKHVMEQFSQISAVASYQVTLGDIRETAKRVSFMRQMATKEEKYRASIDAFLHKINQ